ncbi:MauE/DoxX family redox-associated membrane protein [Novosphingobium terrae]|uniref:MauE/DoxX family redox-associated membrane protein n=1 Tax=Novosphingobium terrae TaxID=2726189 RepID=UPI001F14300F|nr:MauE/DoxX family redox-associated membrane protein [Novosphingobium terrae]
MQALSFFLALVLGAACLHKWTERDRLIAATATLTGVGLREAPFLLLVAGLWEALAAITLLVPGLTQIGAVAGAALWTLYAAALWRRRGQRIDCGCDFMRRDKPVSTGAILRPVVLAAVAVMVALLPAGAFSPDLIFAALGFAALWFAAGEFLSLPLVARAR